jgi:putative ABC transport system permease protein
MGDFQASIRQDVRFAWRGLLRDRVFTAVAVSTLALGIGANSAIYTLVDGVLLRSLPFARPTELVSVAPDHSLLRAEYAMARERLRSVTALAGYQPRVGVSISGEGEAIRAVGALISANLLATLGVEPIGRDFEPVHEQANSGAVAIISHRLWRARYAGEQSVLGRALVIDGATHHIIGVMPADFAFPDADTDVWLPATIDAAQPGTFWGVGGLRAVGRLRAGATAAQVQAELRGLAEAMRLANPFWTPNAGYRNDNTVVPLRDALVGNARTMLLVLMGAVVLVWLIACANVGNLMLARGLGREREIALRMALGAGRSRILRQLLTESAVLSLIGGASGLAAGWVLLGAVVPRLPADLPRLPEVAMDVRVLGFTAVASILAAIVFGVLPAFRVASRHPAASVAGGQRAGASMRQRRLSSGIIVAEVALAAVLVTGAGLLLRSVGNLSRVDTGFATEQVVTARLSLPPGLYREPAKRLAFYEQIIERVRGFPGVHDVALTRQLPFDGELSLTAAAVEHVTTDPNDLPVFELRAVTPDYFRTLRIPLVEGRTFTGEDRPDRQPVALVDRATAERFWPGESALGRRIGRPWLQEWRTIVGVVGTVRNNELKGERSPTLYVPMAQEPGSAAVLAVRTNATLAGVGGMIRTAVAEADPAVPVSHLLPFDDLVTAAASRERIAALLIGAFAALAMLLGAVGLYGVLSYAVTRRAHELSVRSALGATRNSLLGMVLREGLSLGAIGVAIGLPSAVLAGRALRSLLYGVDETDPANLAIVALALLVTCTLAALIPALRAVRAEPAKALRG